MEKTLKWNAFPYEEPSWRLNISAPISVMQAFWQQCLESLKRLTQNTPKIYTTWFEVLKPTYWNEKDGILTLEAPAPRSPTFVVPIRKVFPQLQHVSMAVP